MIRIDDIPTMHGGAPPPEAAEAAPRDEFLRLFVAQLEHQNPLDPQSGAEFVAQLAQFASLEQVAETNQQLESMHMDQIGMRNAALAGFVGKTADASAEVIAIDSSGQALPNLAIDLPESAKSADVVIYDDGGREVQRIALGPSGSGSIPVPWDGTDSAGVPLPEGHYRVEVQASAEDGTEIAGRAVLTGTIDAIEFEDGLPRLSIGGVSIAPGDIMSIR